MDIPATPNDRYVYNGVRSYARFGSNHAKCAVMGGKPCVRGMRVTVGMIVGLVASGHAFNEILAAYPYLGEEDIRQALAYAAWSVEEIEVPLLAA